MGKKGNKRKTRWRVLPIGGDNGDSLCSTNDDDGDGDRGSSSPTTPVNGSWSNGRPAFSPRGPPKTGKQRFGYQQSSYRQHPQRGGYNDSKPQTVTTEKKTFNEEEYTKITTPRQDVLFKKGYLGRKKPALTNSTNSADATAAPSTEVHPCDTAGAADHEPTEPPETPHFLCTNGYVDQGGVYYINGGSYELYDPYTGNLTVVVGPAPHGPPVLAAVSCQPVPLQPLEWFNPPFHSYVSAACPDRRKRSSTDSQNWSPQSSESTDPPGSPQEGEDVGLQNGVVESLEDCTVYQHTHQPPAYVYPGYMFGPAVYNMNGINIQGLPPQPQSIDISGSKRRKKKRRRRRRRGGADDGSDESTSDENELEEPASLTSQESSQELESDSKNSAESTSCQGGSPETNSSEPSPDTTVSNSVNISEDNTHDQHAVTYSPSSKLQPTAIEYPRPTESERSEGERDTPITNSCVPDSNNETSVNTVNHYIECSEVNHTSPSKVVSESIPVQNSCDEHQTNGPSKVTNSSLECNNTSNSIDYLTSPHKLTQNSVTNGSGGLGVNNAVTTKEKGKGKRTSKGSKHKQQQQQHNHFDYTEGQSPHVQLQTTPSKMDGNECSKSRSFNDGTDHSDVYNENHQKTKVVSSRLDQAKSSGVTHGTGNNDTSSNEPPKKPLRKDHSQQQKQSQKKQTSSAHKERKERAGNNKPSKTLLQSSSDDSRENQITSPEVESTKSVRNSDECGGRPLFETEVCGEQTRVSPCATTSTLVSLDSAHRGHTAPLYTVAESKEYCFESKEQNYCSDEPPTTEENLKESRTASNLPFKGDSIISEIKGEKENSDVTNLSEERLHCGTTIFDSNPSEKVTGESRKDASIVEEMHSSPPVPPPRRKKWHPYTKRPSTERPPTPGRDLEERRSSEVLTDDSSSTSTSRESEESVIEIVTSACNTKGKQSTIMAQHSSESEESLICDTLPLCNTTYDAQLQKAIPQTRIPSHTSDSLHMGNVSSGLSKNATENIDKKSSSGIAQHSLDFGQTTHKPNLQQIYSIKELVNCRETMDRTLAESNSKSTKHEIGMAIEKFSEDMASRVIQEAMMAIKGGKPDQVLSWPITEAVTKWLRTQSTEEVLPVPELRDSETDSLEDVEEESTKSANAILENASGPKNVLRNPLPASLHKCSCKDDDVGIRVATNDSEIKHLSCEICSNMTVTQTIADKTHDINNNKHAVKTPNVKKEEANNVSESGVRLDSSDTCPMISNEGKIISNVIKDELHEPNYPSSLRVAEIAFTSFQDDIDSMVTGESGEYDADWECETVTFKQSLHVSDNNDTNRTSESPDCQCLHMCDPALSVAKYYRLGPSTDKADTISQDQLSSSCIESEEEIDSLEHFRNELYDSDYVSCHRSLADELEFCEKPLPESWSIDQIKISKENNVGTSDIFKMKYADCTASDSGIQSEESGTEDSRKPSTNSSNIFSNSARLFNRNSTIHMTGITTDGPFPCGGICCILQ